MVYPVLTRPRIQNELDELAGLQNLINNTITTTSTIIKDWGNNILNGKIKDQKASSSLIPHTAVGVFTGGGFASDPLSSDVISGIHKSVYKYMWSTAIGYLWNSQNIYIIKLSSDLGTWGKPCDIHLDKNMARVCDGDTAYLFGFPWSEQQDGPIYGADDDTLAAYDLTLLELAKGAKKTQDTYGFAKNIDDSSKSAITKNYEDPSSSTDLFVGIPLCDLDAIEDFWRSHKDDWDGIIMTAQVKLPFHLSTCFNSILISRPSGYCSIHCPTKLCAIQYHNRQQDSKLASQ